MDTVQLLNMLPAGIQLILVAIFALLITLRILCETFSAWEQFFHRLRSRHKRVIHSPRSASRLLLRPSRKRPKPSHRRQRVEKQSPER